MGVLCEGRRGSVDVPLLLEALALWHDTFRKAPHQERALSISQRLKQSKVLEGKMSRHNRPASSWGESEQEIQDISFALIALQEIGPTVKRPGLPGASSFVERSVSPCRRRSASVEERKREVPLEIRDEVQESCPR